MTSLLESRPSRQWVPRSTILLVDDDPFQAFARKTALKRQFAEVERASDAAETFIKIGRPELMDSLSLIIVGLHATFGVAGPAFIDELVVRAPQVPILVIGREGEIAHDYAGENVRFLPRYATSQDVLEATSSLLSAHLSNVA